MIKAAKYEKNIREAGISLITTDTGNRAMAQIMMVSGNEAVARGAIQAGCKYFFGYPITPQSDIPEYMSRELPKIGGVFVQSESETASIYMVYGGALTGERVMTSTSSPGFSLMQEGVSYIAEMETPAVVVNVQRLGPGIGVGGQGGQMDYRQAVKGGGHGGYRNIVLAPCSPQETFDLMQVAFHLADKYRLLSLVMTDFIVGQLAETVEIKTLDLGPLPDKPWGLRGKDKKGGRRDFHVAGVFNYGGVLQFNTHQEEKYKTIIDNEIRFDTYLADDAELLIVSWGSSARIAKGAVKMARAEGMKVGLFRPITLWPYPEEQLREAALKAGKVLMLEDNQGQMLEDVVAILQGKIPVSFLGIWARHNDQANGIIHPERVFQEVKELI